MVCPERLTKLSRIETNLRRNLCPRAARNKLFIVTISKVLLSTERSPCFLLATGPQEAPLYWRGSSEIFGSAHQSNTILR